jgi:hypothetical protein
MLKIHLFVASVLFGIAPVVYAPVAWAQVASADASAAATGTISARAYNALPAGAAIVVQPADDTDQSQRLKSAIELALKKDGYRVTDDGPLVLEFYSTEVLGPSVVNSSDCHRPDAGWLGAANSAVPCTNQFPSTTPLAQLNQSLFGAVDHAPNQPGAAPTPPQVHLSIMLNNRQIAKRVWQGSASGELVQPDTFAATAALVPMLVAKLGQTVGFEQFDMPIAMR